MLIPEEGKADGFSKLKAENMQKFAQISKISL